MQLTNNIYLFWSKRKENDKYKNEDRETGLDQYPADSTQAIEILRRLLTIKSYVAVFNKDPQSKSLWVDVKALIEFSELHNNGTAYVKIINEDFPDQLVADWGYFFKVKGKGDHYFLIAPANLYNRYQSYKRSYNFTRDFSYIFTEFTRGYNW